MVRGEGSSAGMVAGDVHGRIGKRKPRRPVRSLSMAERQPAFCTLRMTFLDDYQRNPGAYSRALMGTQQTLPGTRSSLSPPPLSNSSSQTPEQQRTPTPPLLQPQPPALRKDISATIRRLFPSLDDPVICKMAAAKASVYRPLQTPSPQPQSLPTPAKSPFNSDDLSREIFDMRPSVSTCSVKWAKAAPMDVSEYPMAEHLSSAERECCSILRLLPEQYLSIKQSLVRAGRTKPPGSFKKRDAQKLCRVDVNKTSKVFEWFCKLGWIPQTSSKATATYSSLYY
ncbi:hypothetical protein COEREDRAFT_6597 [Coemansia reversa NRRL 1564]|uniref:SWIRM domain-containing protein n=1 Tax=Coemansia reversa (strain ATCC 12441 / NRRL 1564) TaxID=763665 RepID=A0A2G5BH97_COERN|nr:hypothetical protein COEREDRAFT_6597 [Coemansia reversa NRRL 1564]|eukprot:PIA18361.1 hypothetical protein COEREDRAFT_6597 [Coemansia reversa NRRL 1564]